MTEQIKQCRVCGDPINAHRLPLMNCIREAYQLSPTWPGDYKAVLLLCLKNDYLASYGGSAGMGVTTVWFKHLKAKTSSRTPEEAMAAIVLTDLAPQKPSLKVSEVSESDTTLLEEEEKDETEEEHTIVDEDGEQVG